VGYAHGDAVVAAMGNDRVGDFSQRRQVGSLLRARGRRAEAS
jgi:hypothetical protein